MYDGLKPVYINELKRLVSRYPSHSIRFMEVDKTMLKKIPPKISYTWPPIVYYRLFLCDILHDYSKVIYSDVDVLFYDDLSELYNDSLEGYDLANIPCEYNKPNMIHMGKYYSENHKEYLYWSGFFVSNLEHMRNNHWIDRLILNIENHGDNLKMFCTELLDLTSVDVKTIPMRYCVLQSIYYNRNNLEKAFDYTWMKYFYSQQTIQKEIENMVILHYAGPPGKPWLMSRIPEEYAPYFSRVPQSIKRQNNYERMVLRARNVVKKIYNSLKKAGLFHGNKYMQS